MRKKDRTKNHFPHLLLLSRSSLLGVLPLPPGKLMQGDGQWGLWSLHSITSLLLLPPPTLPLLQRGAPTTDYILP